MASKNKFYVVWKGRRTGIFTTWDEADAQVNGFAGAQYKGFATRAEAERALREPYDKYVIDPKKQLAEIMGVTPDMPMRPRPPKSPLIPSYCADAACSGNPGVMEYRCVNTETGEELFARGPFAEGTSNIGEFLGIVETLMLLHERGDASPVYSDSRNALSWVNQKKCKTQLPPNARNRRLFTHIQDAELWLRENKFPNKILKWRTEEWGENPADYGRK